MGKIIEEEFKLKLEDMTTLVNVVGLASGLLQPLYELTVPVGLSYVFRPSDTFSAYLQIVAAGAEAANGDPVDIIITDSSRQSIRSLLNQLRYVNVTEFQDVELLKHLDIPAGNVVTLKEGERLQIRSNQVGATLDVSKCYFMLTCKRIRSTLF